MPSAPLCASVIGPAISGDGRHIAFCSGASNLVPDDTNFIRDVFVHNTVTGSTRQSFHVTERHSGRQLRFVTPGPHLSPAECDAVVDAVRRCWASLWEDRAVRYRHERGFGAGVPVGIGAPAIVGHVLYQLDVNVRAATLLGIVGGGGIGYMLLQATRTREYEVVTLIMLITFGVVLVVEGLAMLLRRLLR